MAAYCINADVQARVAPRVIDATSKPTATMVDDYIAMTQAILDGALAAVGFSVPITSTRGVLICKDYTIIRCAALVMQAKDSGLDLPQNTELSQSLLVQWQMFLDRIRTSPGEVAAMLGVAFGTGVGAGDLRAYTTDNPDSLSISGGDFDPTFTRKTEW